MKKKEIIRLKNSLHPLFFEISCIKHKNILDSIQFFDENPSSELWDMVISEKEHHIIFFKEDLFIKSRHLNYENSEQAYTDLKKVIEEDRIFQIFANREISIFIKKHALLNIINCLDFFNDDYLLYCYDSQSIITGGFSGFTIWEKYKINKIL